MDDAENVEIKQVAQFVANPIEIVEYQRVQSQCTHCGIVSAANWSDETIPGPGQTHLKLIKLNGQKA